jgi:hypothetical protein
MRAMSGAPGSQGYHQIGNVAYLGGDYDGATRGYQRSLGISERLGNQADMATSYSQPRRCNRQPR